MVIHGGALIDGQVRPHMDLLARLREQQEDYDQEYRQAVIEFFFSHEFNKAFHIVRNKPGKLPGIGFHIIF